MSYCQLNPDGTFLREVYGDIQEWAPNVYCGVDALVKDGLAAQFHVVPLMPTDPPTYNSLTQTYERDGCEQVNGAWQYKWRVIDFTPAQIVANYAETESSRIAALWQAAHDYEYAQVSGSAIGLLAIGVLQGLPKCLAVQAWIKSIWALYYTRKAGTSSDTDYSGAGLCPHSVPELMVELGI